LPNLDLWQIKGTTLNTLNKSIFNETFQSNIIIPGLHSVKTTDLIVAALIPARGGSKRIPGKNLLPVNGKPLLSYTIDTALRCDGIGSVWVSTDDDEIAEAAKNFRSQVIRRPNELAEDTSSSEDALLHFAKNVDFDILVFIQATSPLTTAEQLKEGLRKVVDGEAESVLSVTEDRRFYWWANHQSGQKIAINYEPQLRPRSQDKELWYKETGAFYITRRDNLLASKCRISGNIDFVVVPEVYGLEIDTYEDVGLIEAVLSGWSYSTES